MRNYRRIGDYIKIVDERNKGLQVKQLLGLSISKQFIPSVANIIGTDMENYKIIRKNQFACSTMQVRRDKKMPVALLQEVDEAIISQAYPIFEVKNEKELLPEYLMMWFTRSEFDREACFHAVGGVRGSLEWEDFLDMELPVPSSLAMASSEAYTLRTVRPVRAFFARALWIIQSGDSGGDIWIWVQHGRNSSGSGTRNLGQAVPV